ncbi:MAG: hypothetical protein Q8R76_10595 [Candidatus Omnitrophota bacterium]|nr:hypothetical protein [Candidatus Omnitrophota bacterium]
MLRYGYVRSRQNRPTEWVKVDTERKGPCYVGTYNELRADTEYQILVTVWRKETDELVLRKLAGLRAIRQTGTEGLVSLEVAGLRRYLRKCALVG